MRTVVSNTARGEALTVCFLLIVSLTLFHAVVFYPFVTLDDAIHIYRNPWFQPFSWESVRSLWSQPFQGFFIPVTYVFWGGLAELSSRLNGGPSPFFNPHVYHAASLILHSLNSVLVFFLIRSLITRRMASLLGALLFLIHPLQVESVAWISATKDLLATFFAFLSMLLFLKRRGGVSAWRYLLSLALFALGLLSKPSIFGLPFMLLVLALAKGSRPKQTWIVLSPFFFFSLIEAILNPVLQPVVAGVPPVSFWYRPLLALDAFYFYLGKLFFPGSLVLNYGRTPQIAFQSSFLWTLPAALLLFYLVFWRRRKWKEFAPSLALMGLALLPTLGLLPFYYQKFSTVADRFTYFAFFPLGLGLAVWLSGTPRIWKYSVTNVGLFFLSAQTLQQIHFWETDRALIVHRAEVNPTAENHFHAALILEADLRGRPLLPFLISSSQRTPSEKEKAEWNAAIDWHYAEAIRLNPNYAVAYQNLALRASDRGQTDLANLYFRKAISIDSTQTSTLNNYGVFLAKQNLVDEAIEQFRRVLTLDPTHQGAYLNLGMAFQTKEFWEEAAKNFEKALKLDPNLSVARVKLEEVKASMQTKKR